MINLSTRTAWKQLMDSRPKFALAGRIIIFEIDRFFLFLDNTKMLNIFLDNLKPIAGWMVFMGFLGAFSPGFADQVVTISGTSYTLVDTNRLTSERAVKRAKADADSAISAVASAARKAEDDGKALQIKLSNYAESAQAYREKNSAYTDGLKALFEEANLYNKDVDQYTHQLIEHNKRVEALNALKPENRDEATAKALDAEADKLSNWLAKLSKDQAALDAKTNDFTERGIELGRQSKPLSEEGTLLHADIITNLVAMDGACQQLQSCYNYVQQINALLKKYHVNPAPQDDAKMNDYVKSLDQLKALETCVKSNAFVLHLR